MQEEEGTCSHWSRSAATTARAGLHALALAHLHCRLVVNGCRAHALLDLSSHGQEGLLNVRSILGRSLQERNAEAVGEFLIIM